jgi:exopolysaccharide biosynthesis polyprenyl glycosylphosphotransferase
VALRPYDSRKDRERGDWRYLARTARRILRVTALCVLDLLTLSIALGLALGVGGAVAGWAQLLPAVLVIQYLSLIAVGAYGPGSLRADGRRRLQGIVLSLAALGVLGWFYPALTPEPLQLAAFAALAVLGLEVERRGVQRVVGALRRRGYFCRPALIVGTAAESHDIEEYFRAAPHSDLVVVGHVAEEGRRDPTALGTVDRLEALIRGRDVDAIIVADSISPTALAHVMSRAFATGASVISVPSAAHRAACRLSTYPPIEMPIVVLHPPGVRLPQLALKRALDLVLSLIMLLLAIPVWVLIALAIKLDSEGPVLFRQTRVGLGGRTFRLYKFRTMCVDAERMLDRVRHLDQYGDGRLFKIKGDPRITRVGRVLRRTSLDELPQLLNVIRGEMSLIGPRPPVPAEVATYEEEHLERLTVIPGLSGPWQVQGRSNITDFGEVVRLEREYIRDWSLWLDLKILLRTLVVVVRGDGAQ